ncbi:hypothetical protein [Arenimonas composti]|uniref:Lectin n=1 Tax=Arenimonas composti TR7-09 = DSM 18010 TaxID=1121013 RepID=A0A091BER1_9GAMM|nr:hypothetical protein [Arenimonas composti]KFN50231.1 hypothetical protein P873_07690 [Arenimonas composti TR7-09 = DSM 18010]
MGPRTWAAAAVLLLAAACSGGTDAPETAPAPAADADPATTGASAPAPATEARLANDPDVVHFQGFGSAAFGAGEAEVRSAFGAPMAGRGEYDSEDCYYLQPDGGGQPGFMMLEGGFARYDVWDTSLAAPGDLVVGDHADDVLARFPGRVEQQPHKYEEGGRYLVVTPEDGSRARLVFEVGSDGIISGWRIGLPPAVHYVEGCS